ncbi:PREDICTED: olfactory receptor 5B12-like [Calidris pugnax]|uniref:olfactory receptor 5B12-like n=1 Tax=Calidris pugnax TaxID=198806 RepID=UPI00071D0FCC|nr:PREDICTED: olfactory receptor 5B12-like [Calidris pugnax]
MFMRSNHTVTKFVLLGLAESPEVQPLLFWVFLLIYVLTLLGNIGMMTLVRTDPRLHTPMYFFLHHLSFADACYSTVIMPNMLVSFISGNKDISFPRCVAQLYSFVFFGIVECYLLAVMAYDRYAAVCSPLRYMVILPKTVCIWLVSTSYLLGFLYAAIYTGCAFGGSFCSSNVIDHFFCDIGPLLKLSCSDSFLREKVIFAFVSLNGISTSGIIFISYLYILSAVLRMHSVHSRSKAFNTCVSHLMVVSLFYGTGFFMYLQPSTNHNGPDKVAAVFYTLVTPLLNPFIYSLRNREVKEAFMKHMKRCLSSSLNQGGRV